MLSRSISLAAIGLSSLVLASAAQAADDNATFSLNLPALSYTSTNSEVKPEGVDAAKSKTDGMATHDWSTSYASIGFGKYVFYYYPWSGIKTVSIGYLVSDMIEVGIDLGINNSKTDKPKSDSSNNTIGLYGYAYPKLGAIDSEIGLIIDSIAEKGTETTTDSAGVETEKKTNTATTEMSLIVNAIVPIKKNLNYVGGIWYKSSSEDDKEGKVKTTSSTFGVNLATMRLTLD